MISTELVGNFLSANFFKLKKINYYNPRFIYRLPDLFYFMFVGMFVCLFVSVHDYFKTNDWIFMKYFMVDRP